MKNNINEEIIRNRELMGLSINEGFIDKLKELFGNAYDKIVDFLKDDDEKEKIEKKVGKVEDLKDKDVEKIVKYYQEETDDNTFDRTNSKKLEDFFKSENIKSYNGIFSAGDMKEDAAINLKSVLKNLKNEIPEIKITITSANDIFHKNRGKSNHTEGRAIDFIFTPKNEETTKKVYEIFCNARKKLKGFSFIDEYKFNFGGTGGHFHISFDPGRVEDTIQTKRICNKIEKTED